MSVPVHVAGVWIAIDVAANVLSLFALMTRQKQ